jgi:ElaB/YqjD/DUF883 family membrane-anchored ribosome-binding protein
MEQQHKDGTVIEADHGALRDEPDFVPRVVESARRADEKLVALVREHPVATLCAAAFTGYLIGRIMSRFG